MACDTGGKYEKLENRVGGSKTGLTTLGTSAYLEGIIEGWVKDYLNREHKC